MILPKRLKRPLAPLLDTFGPFEQVDSLSQIAGMLTLVTTSGKAAPNQTPGSTSDGRPVNGLKVFMLGRLAVPQMPEPYENPNIHDQNLYCPMPPHPDSPPETSMPRAGAETPLNFREKFRASPRTILKIFSAVDTQTVVLVSTAEVWISAPDTQTPIFLVFWVYTADFGFSAGRQKQKVIGYFPDVPVMKIRVRKKPYLTCLS